MPIQAARYVRRAPLLAFSLLLPAGCAAPVGQGSPCTRPTDCPPPLICSHGECVEPPQDASLHDGRDASTTRPKTDLGPLPLEDARAPLEDARAPSEDAHTAEDARPAEDAHTAEDARPAEDAHAAEDAHTAEDAEPTGCVPNTVRDCGGPTVGICRTGTQICTAQGVFGECVGAVAPQEERCNGIDDNCDGQVDEGFNLGEPCQGRCGGGVYECDEQTGGRRCSTDVRPSETAPNPEICNGIDDNCDGQIDEGFELGRPCQAPGVCGAGVWECDEQTGGRRCSSGPGGSQDRSRPEICNNQDDNCDGQIDEGFDVGAVCFAPGICGEGRFECGPQGVVRCSSGPGGSQDRSQLEICNGVDDNCDGRVDEGFGVGERCEGVGLCGDGQWECDGRGGARCSTLPGGSADESREESCNGVDDDCNGIIDDNLAEGELCGGDTCAEAPQISLSAAYLGDTRALNDRYSLSTCIAETPGPEQVLRTTLPQPGAYLLSVAPRQATFDPVFWLFAGDCAQSNTCLRGSGLPALGRPKALAFTAGQAGEHHIVVDSRTDGGTYALTLQPFAQGERCTDAVPLRAPALGERVHYVGTLAGRSDDVTGTQCPPGHITNGVDHVLQLQLNEAQTLRVTLKPAAGLLPVVFFVKNNCEQVDAQCGGHGVAPGVGQPVIFDAALDAGRWYLVVESGLGGTAGAYHIEVERID